VDLPPLAPCFRICGQAEGRDGRQGTKSLTTAPIKLLLLALQALLSGHRDDGDPALDE